jgi:hypothetical protein
MTPVFDRMLLVGLASWQASTCDGRGTFDINDLRINHEIRQFLSALSGTLACVTATRRRVRLLAGDGT